MSCTFPPWRAIAVKSRRICQVGRKYATMICTERARERSCRSARLIGLRPRPGPLKSNCSQGACTRRLLMDLRSRTNRRCASEAAPNISSKLSTNSFASGPFDP